MSFDISSLVKVGVKGVSAQEHDLVVSGTRFTIKESAFAKMNLQENGFDLLLNPENGEPILKITPCEESSLFRQRANSTKRGNFFNSTSLSHLVKEKFGKNVKSFDFSLLDTGTDDEYYSLIPGEPVEPKEEKDPAAPKKKAAKK